jgi:DNA polymerase (family 10)
LSPVALDFSSTASSAKGCSVDNGAIARIFAEIADLLELKGENPFKIRAYRFGAETIAALADRLADLDAAHLLEIPGIGKDLSARIREIVETGDCRIHLDLLGQFPPTLLELRRLQGVGPKTAALLHRALDIHTLDDLGAAAREGRIRSIKGMGPRKEEMILKALEERRAGPERHLLTDARAVADLLVGALQHRAPATRLIAVGSLRRGVETCGDLDILAIGDDRGLIDDFTTHPLVGRVLGRGDTKASVLLRAGMQADLRFVAPECAGAAMQYFTGSRAHNIVLRDRAMARGLKLNEYGLFRVTGGERVAGETEESIYEALGLAWVPPELRENRGEIEAAERRALPRLIELGDLCGDLHAHSTASDGRDDVEAMALAARAAGLSYLAITDHSQALAMANGLDEREALAHAQHVRDVSERIDGIRLLTGIECDIKADGTLDLADDCLAQLDVVVASVHSALQQSETQMTERILRAMESPFVHIIGHPTSRLLLRRNAYRVDLDAILDAAAERHIALEINSQVDRLDLGDVQARHAASRGVKIVVSSDSHSKAAYGLLKWGVTVARRAWLSPADVLNTRPIEELLAGLKRS